MGPQTGCVVITPRLIPSHGQAGSNFRVADHTSCLSGFAGHRSTRADQSMELENLELD
jgi:hypothetical protein